MPRAPGRITRRVGVGLAAAILVGVGLGLPASAATDGAEADAGRVAVISPTLDVMENGNKSGLPLVTGTAASLVANQLPAPGEQPALDPALTPIRDALLVPGQIGGDLTESGADQIDQAQDQVAPLAPINPVVDPALDLTAETLASAGEQLDGTSDGPYGTTLRELSTLVRFFESGE